MLRSGITLAIFVIGLALTNLAAAQHHHHHHGHAHACNVGRGSYYGAGGYAYVAPGYGMMTYEESVLRGMADYTRAMAQANLLHAQAAAQWQQARTQRYHNEKLKTETYFQKKEIYAAATTRTRLSPEGYAKLARREMPARLSESHYHRATGRITWPAALLDDAFRAEREQLQAAFASRSPADVGVGTTFQTRVSATVDAAQGKLKVQIRTLKPQQFLAAKNFLASLAYEAEQPPTVTTLAVAE